ncbi:MAG: RNA pseudouridine synthase [Planctomycetaceae bacterium]|nr:RNA pseudouridine synthase [Planctomycetaceae bacterium]
MSFQFIVDEFLSGRRIDHFLIRQFRNYSAARMQRMVRLGYVTINDVIAHCDQVVYARQSVSIRLVDPPDKLYEPEVIKLDVIYEDPWIIVLNKSADLIVHPTGSFDSGTLANAVQHHFDQQTEVRGLIRPGIVHRLDRETSGLIVMTKEHTAHRGLMDQFEHHRVSKSYLAVVEGLVEADNQFIDFPIGRLTTWKSPLMSAAETAQDAKPASTFVSVVRRGERRTLVEATPFTGRQHQIRVHLSAVGHPIVDDPDYTAFAAREDRIDESIRSMGRQALHAWRLSFRHPIDSRHLAFETSPPDEFDRLLIHE